MIVIIQAVLYPQPLLSSLNRREINKNAIAGINFNRIVWLGGDWWLQVPYKYCKRETRERRENVNWYKL